MDISPELIAAAEQLIGLRFTAAERELMRDGLHKQLENYAQLRSVALANDVPPALLFNPQLSPGAATLAPPSSANPVLLPSSNLQRWLSRPTLSSSHLHQSHSWPR